MIDRLGRWLLDPSGLTPHGFCLLWEPGLIWTYALSDFGIGVAYCTIPVALAVFARRRRDLVFKPVLWMFAAFILLCGASHWLDVLTLWIPAYGLEAAVKVVTAAASLLTAITVWKLLPKAVALPSSAQLQNAISALKESKARYRTSFEQSPVPLYTLDAANIVTGASNSWLALMGYTSEEVIGHPIGEFRGLSAETSAQERATLESEGEILDRPRTFLKRDGTVVETLVSARIDQTGDTKIAVCIMIDVTARRQAELALEAVRAEAVAQSMAEARLRQANAVLQAKLQAQQLLQETEARFKFATHAGRLGVWDLDLQTLELTTSPMCRDNFGQNPETIFSFQQMQDAIHPDDRRRLAEAIAFSRDTGADLDGEYQVVRSMETTGWVQLHAQVISAADGVGFRLAGVSLDITERVYTEQRIRHSQRVEAVGRLTAGVAHDFNNVLQALLGGLELAIEEVVGQPQLKADLEFALQAGQRGTKLTSHLLSFSRQQKLSPTQLQVGPLLNALARTLERTLGSNVKIETCLGSDLPNVFADAAHLDSALLNLALNARDAMPNGGVIRLEAYACPGQVVVSVVDTGGGMTPDVLAKACEPFFTTKGAKGSGLGLSMVQGFARQSGGELQIQSTLGVGTKIELWLPLNAADQSQALPQSLAPRQHGSGHILLVDDQEDVSRVTASFLRKSGFVVSTASDGTMALEILATHPAIAALVSDYAMPGMNGAALIQEARELHPNLPALVMTGYASASGLEHLPPNVLVLYKPFQRYDLVSKVKLLIETAELVL